MDQDTHLEFNDENEDSNDGLISCINSGGLSLTDSFVQQRKIQLLKAAQERERTAIREAHLRHETFKIVESLVEGRADEEYLIKCASLLCQTDYDNVHEERSLAYFCGYPLCDNRLEEEAPKKRKQIFKIDYRNRQLYKMDEYKLFCSVLCYKSSYYLREQMFPEPLWLRYTDAGGYDELYQKGFETFKLYHQREEKSENCDLQENETIGYSSSQKSEVKQERTINLKESVSFPYIKHEHLDHLRKTINNLTIKEKCVTENNEVESMCNLEKGKLKVEKSEEKKDELPNHDHKEERDEDKKNSILSVSTQLAENNEVSTSIASGNHVYERLKEWMTFDTFIFIFGSSIIDELIQLRRLKINDDPTSHTGSSNQAEKDEILRKEKMENDIKKICKKLDDEEMLDQLIFETEQLEVGKMKAENELKRKLENDDKGKSKQTKSQNKGVKKVTFDQSIPDTVAEPDPLKLTVLPPTTSKCQNKLRKQLFCRQLERTLTLEKISNEVTAFICPLVRELIDTFKFTSTNVIISNDVWPELLLILLKILDIRQSNNQLRLDDIDIMKEKSVINLIRKIYPENASFESLDQNVSRLLDYSNF